MFRDEVAVLTEPIARSFDLNDRSMVEKPVQQRGGDDGIAEDFAPFGKSAVRGEDHRALFVATIDELEEQIAAARRDRQVSDLVDDEQRWTTQVADTLTQHAIAFGLGQGGNNVSQGGEVDAAAGFDSLDGERGSQMGLAGARRTSVIMPGVQRLKLRSVIRSIHVPARLSSLLAAGGMLAAIISLFDNRTTPSRYYRPG